jgi:hypothetical protein
LIGLRNRTFFQLLQSVLPQALNISHELRHDSPSSDIMNFCSL